MDISHCTTERNVQIVISLLKENGIRKVIASPGTTNITFVRSIQNDPFFEIFSCVDERSAAYMACGMAAESGEPIVLSCTGATASRNYMSGLTEAFYRKLPILAITSTQHTGRIGTYTPQVIDRHILPADIAVLSVEIPTVHDNNDEKSCIEHVNQALLALRKHGGGPVHINLTTAYSKDFSVLTVNPVPVTKLYGYMDNLPEINKKKVAVFVGAHAPWTKEQTEAVDLFCDTYDAVVFCDHTSNYWGRYRMLYSLVCTQTFGGRTTIRPDLVVYIGMVTGDYPLSSVGHNAEVWRVNPDGEIRSFIGHNACIFAMEEEAFFKKYIGEKKATAGTYYRECKETIQRIQKHIPELPFSNIWIASQCAPALPCNSVFHIGILNSLRAWNLFETSHGSCGFSNTGGFGIDGCMSALIGASLCHPDKLYFGFFGDLSFFYDLNSLGNRHLGNNLRILLVNNGKGTEFRNYTHPGAAFGNEADLYIAAGGHFGKQSRDLVKHYVNDLGLEYITASTKEEFLKKLDAFMSDDIKKSIVFEVFTNSDDESAALKIIKEIDHTVTGDLKNMVKNVIGNKNIGIIKKKLRK